MVYYLGITSTGGTQLLFVYLIGIIFGLIIIYYLIKAAVKNGILEARNESSNQNGKASNSDILSDSKFSKLKQQYESGQITFEQFQSEWKKLTS